ncbi:Major Facilitator Superfamily protein [Geodermatophilus amargosae]|uniref:Major Facilitator Superfamily protein n=1 Tax=Geodermatophilus amargosae TaxID=1296565 RepID=A0A1I6X6G2_9ACTN|nr:MFS transporter [Geodermatophilus amargosae]SFT33511.1 Major Facilitator Superfamily protein [Geodermatophilus amargosae]
MAADEEATTTAPAGTGTSRHHARRALVGLCVTQVTSWGVLYYAFPVALVAITADTGWSAPAATAAFSAGLVVSAVAGIPVGRWLDRHGPRRVMTAGSVLAVPATVAIALAPDYAAFLAAWLVAGAAMSAVFYQAAFAALIGWYGDRRVRALTTLTLVAGLASTLFAPLTSVLVTELGWRGPTSCSPGCWRW